MTRIMFLTLLTVGYGLASTPLFTFPTSLPNATIRAAVVDRAGYIYATGTTHGSLPSTPGVFHGMFNNGIACPPVGSLSRGCFDAFVAKFSPAGELVYATYLGGSNIEEAFAVAVDQAGDAWVTGYTFSNDFPTTSNALQKKNAGGAALSPTSPPLFEGDLFLTELNPDGTALLYSSFVGGSGPDVAYALAIDRRGFVYLAGETRSTDFPTTQGSGSAGAGFVASFDPSGPAMRYSTYFEQPVRAMAVDAAGDAYLTGTIYSGTLSTTPGAFQTVPGGAADAFVVKLGPDGATRLYATLLGGSKSDTGDAIAVDGRGNAWIAGSTGSPDFPVTSETVPQKEAGFVARLNADGSALIFAATTGGMLNSVMLDDTGNAYVSGNDLNSPPALTRDALEKSSCGPSQNFITKWSPEGALLYSSYSREGLPLAIDAAANLYLRSYSNTADGSTASLVRLDLNADERPSSLGCMTNAASFTFSGVAPGEILSLFGDRLGPVDPAYLKLDAAGKLATDIGGVRVLFDGVPAPLLYADSNQINVIAPWGLRPGKNTAVAVEYGGVTSPALTVPVIESDPGVFEVEPSLAPTQGAILNEDGSVNSVDNPAEPGSIISIFATGLGSMNPVPQDGTIIPDASYVLQQPVEVTFSGPTTGQVIYAGGAPTLPAGVVRINVRLPNQFPDSDSGLRGSVGIVMRVGNGPSSSVLASVAVK